MPCFRTPTHSVTMPLQLRFAASNSITNRFYVVPTKHVIRRIFPAIMVESAAGIHWNKTCKVATCLCPQASDNSQKLSSHWWKETCKSGTATRTETKPQSCYRNTRFVARKRFFTTWLTLTVMRLHLFVTPRFIAMKIPSKIINQSRFGLKIYFDRPERACDRSLLSIKRQ